MAEFRTVVVLSRKELISLQELILHWYLDTLEDYKPEIDLRPVRVKLLGAIARGPAVAES